MAEAPVTVNVLQLRIAMIPGVTGTVSVIVPAGTPESKIAISAVVGMPPDVRGVPLEVKAQFVVKLQFPVPLLATPIQYLFAIWHLCIV
jgi:hypothetical protein